MRSLTNANAFENIAISFNYKGKAFDISAMATSFSIRETIAGDLTGSIELTDDSGIIDNVILTGDEVINVSFTYFDAKINHEFFFNGIKNINMGSNTNKKTYEILLGSINDYISSTNLVSKSYEGSGTDIIKKIFLDYFAFGGMVINTEAVNIGRYIAPNISPKKAIRAVQSKSYDKNNSILLMFQSLFLGGNTMIDSLYNMMNREYIYEISPRIDSNKNTDEGPISHNIGRPSHIIVHDNEDIIGTSSTGIKGKQIETLDLDNSSMIKEIFRGSSRPSTNKLSFNRDNLYTDGVRSAVNTNDGVKSNADFKASIAFSINATAYNVPAIPGLMVGQKIRMPVSNYAKTRSNSQKVYSNKYARDYIVSGIIHHFENGLYTQNIELSTGIA